MFQAFPLVITVKTVYLYNIGSKIIMVNEMITKEEELQKYYLTHQNVFNAYVMALKESKDINEYKENWRGLERYAEDIREYYEYDSYVIESIGLPNEMRIITSIEFVDIMNNKKTENPISQILSCII